MTRPARVALWVVGVLVAVVVVVVVVRLFGVLGVIGGAGAIASAAVVTGARRTVRQERTAAGRRHAEEVREDGAVQDRLDAATPASERRMSDRRRAEEAAERIRKARGNAPLTHTSDGEPGSGPEDAA